MARLRATPARSPRSRPRQGPTEDPRFELYFSWLYSQVLLVPRNAPLGYVYVCQIMHNMVFIDELPNDDNRSADGRELRHQFLRDSGFNERGYQNWFDEPATILEVLVALCYRADYNTGKGVQFWFKEFLINLGLLRYTNAEFEPKDTFTVERILKRFNERRYKQNGEGGLFPIQNTMRDQRGVELWYQMAEYQRENRMY